MSDNSADALAFAVIEVAEEHIAWCIRQGWAPGEVFDALCLRVPELPNWNGALRACIATYDLGPEIRALRARWQDTGVRRVA